MISQFRLIAPLVLIGASCLGQVTATVGPSPAPIGCAIAITVANDTASPITYNDPCTFQVRDSLGVVIFTPLCIQVITTVNPGGLLLSFWPQVDNLGTQVVPGTYFVDVFFPGGSTSTTPVVVDSSTVGAIAEIGPTRIGSTRNLYLCSLNDQGLPYFMAASGPPVSGGIPTCGGLVPLEFDALLQLSINPNPFFLNFTGNMSSSSMTMDPQIAVPNAPALIGMSFTLAFVVLDFTAPNCVVRTISSPLSVTVN
jgi:hypothetical protein